MRDFPVMKDKNAIQQINQQVVTKWSNLGVKGIIKSGLGNTPEHQTTKAAIVNAGKNDRMMTQRVYRKDPENLQVKR